MWIKWVNRHEELRTVLDPWWIMGRVDRVAGRRSAARAARCALENFEQIPKMQMCLPRK